MRYRLVVLTHGHESTLGRCLASFRANVRPLPFDAYLHADGYEAARAAEAATTAYPEWPWRVHVEPHNEGFCAATRKAWDAAVVEPVPTHVFWLEHDFVFLQPVDLHELAAILDDENAGDGPPLAQMSLLRTAANYGEVAAGGLYEYRHDEFLHRGRWMEQRSYLTTNPSLMPIDFMAANPWPAYPSECEGRFGADLRDLGYRFGVWGRGEPWIDHIGGRTGHGY